MPIDALSVLCAQLTRDLLAIAKFLLELWHQQQGYIFNEYDHPTKRTALYRPFRNNVNHS